LIPLFGVTPVDIQVWSDVICPWCYIGKNRLEKAIADFPGDVTVTFRAYQLDASAMPPGRPIKEVLAAKFGGTDQAEQMEGEIEREGGVERGTRKEEKRRIFFFSK